MAHSKWKTEVALAGKLTGYSCPLCCQRLILGLSSFLPDVEDETDWRKADKKTSSLFNTLDYWSLLSRICELGRNEALYALLVCILVITFEF